MARNLSQYSCPGQESNQASPRYVTCSANRFGEHSETAVKKEMKKEGKGRKMEVKEGVKERQK
jgi:hypothetical protein